MCIRDRFISKNNQITLFPCFTFIPKTGVGLPKTRVSFYCVHGRFYLFHFFFEKIFQNPTIELKMMQNSHRHRQNCDRALFLAFDKAFRRKGYTHRMFSDAKKMFSWIKKHVFSWVLLLTRHIFTLQRSASDKNASTVFGEDTSKHARLNSF